MKKKPKKVHSILTLNCKKGNAIVDTISYGVIIFVFAIAFILIYPAFSDLNTEIQNDNTMTSSAKSISQTSFNNYPSVMDGVFVLVLVLLWIITIIASFQIDSHPIFFVVVIILMVVVVIIAQLLASSYEDLSSDSLLSGVSSTFPMTNYILSNLHIASLIVGGSILIALYGKNRYAV